MTKAGNFLGSIFILIGLNGAVSFLLKTAFIDVSVLIGIASIVGVRMITAPSNWAKANQSGYTNKSETVQFDKEEDYIQPHIILRACYAYTGLFIIVVIVTYFEYFIS
ncbi:hypothetical protein [Jeotgalibacillus campisalis]|uniref:DUF3899 domain-containing protein n=1 Tax=Jeotgalibacillus campisalis TaxID=220754 RepID=A0A0C2VV49_9BACL|nr:hypothetical protein [Jeotgalibacillus campisalis]KIL47863.1 hypothetical protein KR50_20300 [Jeotgalibacillus campisalis]